MCVHVKLMSQTMLDAEPLVSPYGIYFFNLFLEKYIYNFSSLPPHPLSGTTAADACCKSYRGNKRCRVLKYHLRAASLERSPYGCAIRVNSAIQKKQPREGKKTHPFFVVYCPVKRASAPSILTQWSFQMLKGGEGVAVDGVG